MSKDEMLLVLPKISVYDKKSADERLHVRNVISKWIAFAEEYGKRVCCFAEDELAVHLLLNQSIHWLEVLGAADYKMALRQKFYRGCDTLKAERISESVIEAARKKYKSVKFRDFLKEEDYIDACLEVITKRVRCACNIFIAQQSSFTVYVKANNNFCNEPKPVVGDGSKLILTSLDVGVPLYYYSGLVIPEPVMKQILEGETDGVDI